MKSGVVVSKKGACDCLRLYEGTLIDVKGKVIAQFPTRYLTYLSEHGVFGLKKYEQAPWGRYSYKGRKKWELDNTIHHDFFIKDDVIYTFDKVSTKYKGRMVDFDTIVTYDLDGNKLDEWSTWDNVKELKKHHPALELDLPKFFLLPELVPKKEKTPWGGNYDYYRLNSLQVLGEGGKDERFASGNWLISFRHGSMIFVLDSQRKVVYSLKFKDIEGNLEGQHGVQMMADGNLLIFDNGRYRGWSRVIIVDPFSKKIVWEYKADGFFSKSQGYVQELENGNFLVTESEKGRAFEVTRDKKIVWEFLHPDVQDKTNSQHPQSYGQRQWMYRMTAYDKDIAKYFINKRD